MPLPSICMVGQPFLLMSCTLVVRYVGGDVGWRRGAVHNGNFESSFVWWCFLSWLSVKNFVLHFTTIYACHIVSAGQAILLWCRNAWQHAPRWFDRVSVQAVCVDVLSLHVLFQCLVYLCFRISAVVCNTLGRLGHRRHLCKDHVLFL